MVADKIKGKILYFEGTYQAYDFKTGKLHTVQQVNAVNEVQLNQWMEPLTTSTTGGTPFEPK